ncbi:MAG: Cell division coordinator CpoB [Desulfovibrio sp.]
MAGRSLLASFTVIFAAALAFSLGGCAASEDRLAKIEADITHLQAQEIRLAILEDTMSRIVSDQTPDRNAAPPTAPKTVESPPATPRRVTPAQSVPPPSPADELPATPRPVTPAPTAPPAPPSAAPVPAARPASVKSAKFASGDYHTALRTLEAGQPKTAMNLFKAFLANYPSHALAPNAGYWLGECHYTLKQYDAAIIAFKDVVAQFPSHDKAAASMLKAGYSYLQLGDTPNARFYLEALVRDYPASKPAALARERLASL